MTHRLFVLDVPENTRVHEVAAEQETVKSLRIGPYVVLESDDPIVVDRRATGCRHAVWYSCVAGLAGCRITQWDKDALRVEAR
ncbi:hypothetical protein AB0E63_01515 [Kribbella sp. NPDC026596]|jgi:hypothetical protein|uniref:hypothetical protein n=1 Tax=Kribbella sp. NPDC026596 TaxID=3155122 RepID=UPI0033ED32CD